MKRLKTALQSRYLIKVITIIIVTASILITNVYPSKSKYSGKETKITGRITSIQINGDKLTIIIKEKEKLMVNFFFKNKKEKQYYQKNLQLGDKIKIKGKNILRNRIFALGNCFLKNDSGHILKITLLAGKLLMMNPILAIMFRKVNIIWSTIILV